MTTTSGLLLVDKASGMTSHDVVAAVRKIFNERRVGHAGTLDPMATGLLVVGVGPSTRLLRFAQSQQKRYTGTVRLGVATDSLDADGVVVATGPVPSLTRDQMNAAAVHLTGALFQIPPMVSAIKIDGRRLHELARQGVEVERSPRAITVSSFTLSEDEDPSTWHFDVVCSVGTYVRVLLSDLAERLGSFGHLTALRRVESGELRVEDAITLDELARPGTDVASALRAPRSFVEHIEQVVLSDEDAKKMRTGQQLRLDDVTGASELAALDERGSLVGILTRRGERWQPDVVLPDEPSAQHG